MISENSFSMISRFNLFFYLLKYCYFDIYYDEKEKIYLNINRNRFFDLIKPLLK